MRRGREGGTYSHTCAQIHTLILTEAWSGSIMRSIVFSAGASNETVAEAVSWKVSLLSCSEHRQLLEAVSHTHTRHRCTL